MKIWHETTGSGQPLVLIHGWGMNAAIWDPVLDQLNTEFEVTRIDLPGHGYSEIHDGEINPSTDSLFSWSEALLKVVPDNAIWLGWSLGGSVALQAALHQQNKIKALFMMTATPCFAQLDDWRCAMPQTTLNKFFMNLEDNSQKTLIRFLSLQIEGCDNARALLKQLRIGFSSRPAVNDAMLKKGFEFLHETDLRDQLKKIKIPMHWLFGEKDMLVPACISGSISELVINGPETTIEVINGAGHVPFLSHFDDCIKSLKLLAEKVR